MSRPRLLVVGLLASALLGLGLGPTACGTTAGTDALPPITGITVKAETLTAGRGCGPAATQIVKYAVVVLGANPLSPDTRDEFLAASVYDCFADGQFVSLPTSAGSSVYALQVYAYNAAAYTAAGGDDALKGTIARLTSLRAAVADGGAAERAALLAALAQLAGTHPTLSTTCDAVQFPDVQSLAVCQPLAAGAAGLGRPTATASVLLPAASFKGPDGGVYSCDVDFASVRYRVGVDGRFGDPTTSLCSQPTPSGPTPFVITLSPAAAPAALVIELAMLRKDGSLLAQTRCSADTSPGLSSTAACTPAQ